MINVNVSQQGQRETMLTISTLNTIQTRNDILITTRPENTVISHLRFLSRVNIKDHTPIYGENRVSERRPMVTYPTNNHLCEQRRLGKNHIRVVIQN